MKLDSVCEFVVSEEVDGVLTKKKRCTAQKNCLICGYCGNHCLTHAGLRPDKTPPLSQKKVRHVPGSRLSPTGPTTEQVAAWTATAIGNGGGK